MQKIITVESNKKRMNITNFINIYTNIYISNIICDKNVKKNKNNNFIILIRSISASGQPVMLQLKKIVLRNDGDIKMMANSF